MQLDMNCDAQCEKMIGFEEDRENVGVKERKYLVCDGERIGELPKNNNQRAHFLNAHQE